MIMVVPQSYWVSDILKCIQQVYWKCLKWDKVLFLFLLSIFAASQPASNNRSSLSLQLKPTKVTFLLHLITISDNFCTKIQCISSLLLTNNIERLIFCNLKFLFGNLLQCQVLCSQHSRFSVVRTNKAKLECILLWNWKWQFCKD